MEFKQIKTRMIFNIRILSILNNKQSILKTRLNVKSCKNKYNYYNKN